MLGGDEKDGHPIKSVAWCRRAGRAVCRRGQRPRQSFTKNRDRLLDGEIAGKFLTAVRANEKVRGLLSSERFSVDGTLLEAWASPKSFRPKDGSGDPPGPGRNGARDFLGEKRRNDTHISTTDPDARLFRKGSGKEAQLVSWATR
jgi:hypothetical protein